MYDLVIIGGGIVGLSVAYQAKQKYPSARLCLLEKEDEVLQHQSSHNSGVIHSGIYYQPGSLRAINCRLGYERLLTFCRTHGVSFDICGKLIVATASKEVSGLKKILARGEVNGLEGLRWLSKEEALEIEPHIACMGAIYVPQAGIIDYKEVGLTYARLFEAAGGEIHLGQEVKAMVEGDSDVQITTSKETFRTRKFISCAGLYSDQLARLTIPNYSLQILPFRGEYFQLKKDREYLVKHLIYPVPDPNFPFLGVHFTRMIKGGIEAGPNAVLAFRREGYHFNQIHSGELWQTLRFPGFRKLARRYWQTGLSEMYRSISKVHFVTALQKLIPDITGDDVYRNRSGVRAMACDPAGNLLDDFTIVESSGGLHVVNAPSPAATASLAIGQEIISRLKLDQ